jgi:endoglucanase
VGLRKDKVDNQGISRRAVLKAGVASAAACLFGGPLAFGRDSQTSQNSLIAGSINPRWYGFNLLEYFSTDTDWMKYFPYQNDGQFKEDDFRWIRDWGFNWVRLPMDYRFWTDPGDLLKIREKQVEPIDRAIKLGQKYRVHVNINLHRAPGECILDMMDEKVTGIHITKEKNSVYNDRATLEAFVHQWSFFARRYKGIPNEQLSFNLVNEPIEWDDTANTGADKLRAAMKGSEGYVHVAREAIAAIRAEDPQRLIVTDGYKGGGEVIPQLYDTKVMQSCHDYFPVQLTHYHNPWARPMGDNVPLPTWPLQDATGHVIVDKQTVIKLFAPWSEAAQAGIPLHFGEMGCDKNTPPAVVYAWYNDSLDVINGLRSGWALWNFRGPFGILDTGRAGTDFKKWHGHQLDAKLLSLLQSKMLS